LGNVNSVNLKRAKELERQRAQKQHKQAAHQRSLKRQQEAELCRMREEIEKEKASMLAAAEAELAAIRASIKSQGRALRQRNRRATAVRDVEPAADSLANHNECKEQQQEELAQFEEMPAAAANDSCCDSPDHQDAVSSVESAEVMADSSNEDDEVLEAQKDGRGRFTSTKWNSREYASAKQQVSEIGVLFRCHTNKRRLTEESVRPCERP
jgi:hypothetical protein